MVSLPKRVFRAATALIALGALCFMTAAFAIEGRGTVSSSTLRMRAAASNSAQVVEVLAEGTEVVVLSQESDGWYKVLHNGAEGYLAADHITVNRELGNGKVSAGKLTVHTGPGGAYASAGTLNQNTVVEITGSEGEWYIVSWNGIKGYVNARDLTLTNEAVTQPPKEPTTAEKLVATSKQYLGKRYSYGASGPNAFDCSGFTMFIFKQYGVSLPHTCVGQRRLGASVEKSELQLGDLVFFLGTGHVGIYIGGGQFIHASTTNYNVTTNSLTSGYWARHYSGACRILK